MPPLAVDTQLTCENAPLHAGWGEDSRHPIGVSQATVTSAASRSPVTSGAVEQPPQREGEQGRSSPSGGERVRPLRATAVDGAGNAAELTIIRGYAIA
jgi:hypothetical protein